LAFLIAHSVQDRARVGTGPAYRAQEADVMANATTTPSATSAALGWRTPVVILLCGCMISLVSFGPRATLGFFLAPQSQANGWDQVGSFLGAWLGGVAFERMGTYDSVWWLAVLFGVLSAVINLPIIEQPVRRLAPATAG
jgi:predicted MFS family arabinose efflux permease